MDGANVKSIKGAEKISQTQHLDILSSDKHKGKYWYFIDDPNVETPYVGIDKTNDEYAQTASADLAGLIKWLNGDRGGFEIPINTVEPEAAKANQEMFGLGGTIDDQSTLFEATPGPMFEGLGSSVDLEKLKADVIREKEAYFPLFRTAAVLEAKLKALQQKFDEDNAELIAQKKAAVAARDEQAKALKAAAVIYGNETDDRQFDQYISFRENKEFEWDEPQLLAWLKENFPAAVVVAGESIDSDRVKTYIRDCLKREQPLPPSVKVKEKLEALISSKIPVPELEGGAA